MSLNKLTIEAFKLNLVFTCKGFKTVFGGGFGSGLGVLVCIIQPRLFAIPNVNLGLSHHVAPLLIIRLLASTLYAYMLFQLGRRMFQVGIQWDTIVLHGVYDDGNILNHQIDAMLTRLFILCIT